jgi:hypothetical protein
MRLPNSISRAGPQEVSMAKILTFDGRTRTRRPEPVSPFKPGLVAAIAADDAQRVAQLARLRQADIESWLCITAILDHLLNRVAR